jgi:cell division protein FtsW (lipid II flippase)
MPTVKPSLVIILLLLTATALQVSAFVGPAAPCTRHWLDLGLSAKPFEPSETAVVRVITYFAALIICIIYRMLYG